MPPQQYYQQPTNQNAPYNNMDPRLVQRDLNNYSIMSGGGTFNNYSVDTSQFEGNEISSIPKSIPKNVLTLHNAIKMSKYGDKDSFLITQNDAINVVNKTLITSAMMFTFSDDIFMKVVRPTTDLKCNQSVFNYPISITRKNFSIIKVQDNLVKLNTNVMNYKKLVLESLGYKPESDNKTYNVPKDVINDTLRFAARGAAYMNIVYKKAEELLFKLVKEGGPRVYPSIEHHLYEGDYSDLFAFQVLRYLYKADTEKEITITKNRDMGKGLVKENTSKILKKTRIRAFKQESQEYYGDYSSNPSELLTVQEGAEMDALAGMEEMTENEANRPIKMQISSDHSKADDNKPTKAELLKSLSKDLFLKPTRGTKILLATEPNVFLYKLNYAVAKGISILINTGIIPEKIITNLRLVSLYTGAIYKLSSTKRNLSITVDRRDKSYAVMKQQTWSQTALFVDTYPLVNQNDEMKSVLQKYAAKYPTCFFNTTKYHFSGEQYIRGVFKNTSNLIELSFKGEYRKQYMDQLSYIVDLCCRSPMTFCKVDKPSVLKHYNGIAKKIEYSDVKYDVLSASKELVLFEKEPRLPTYVYGQFGLSDDVSFDYYCEGINYTNTSLIFTPEGYMLAAKKDLSSFKRMQIPLLSRADNNTRTRKFAPKAEDLPTHDDTLEELVFNQYMYYPFDKEGKWSNYDNTINEILASNHHNIGTYMLSLIFPKLYQHYSEHPFNVDIHNYCNGLSADQIERVKLLNRIIRNTNAKLTLTPKYKIKQIIPMILRYIFADRVMLDSDISLNEQKLQEYVNHFLSDPKLTDYLQIQNETVSSVNNALGYYVRYLVETYRSELQRSGKFLIQYVSEDEGSKEKLHINPVQRQGAINNNNISSVSEDNDPEVINFYKTEIKVDYEDKDLEQFKEKPVTKITKEDVEFFKGLNDAEKFVGASKEDQRRFLSLVDYIKRYNEFIKNNTKTISMDEEVSVLEEENPNE